tara:strand:- start:433 stop:870 length:438 start_codon:yes stop_codon:yes gene_type:complete
MIDIILFLSKHYDNVYCVKPFTSRPANSEKYLICKGYRGIDTNLLEKLYSVVDRWDKLPENKTFDIIFEMERYNYPLIDRYNNIFISEQIKNIIKTLVYGKVIRNQLDTKYIRARQVVFAKEWCLKYNVEINLACKYIRPEFINL